MGNLQFSPMERLVALPWLSKRSSLNWGTRSSGVDISGWWGLKPGSGRGGDLDHLEAVIKHAKCKPLWRNGTGWSYPAVNPSLAHAPAR